MTPAVLYRAVDQFAPTLLLDEIDGQLGDKTAKAELLGLINAGYRHGALAYRMGGSRRDELESFKTFCAKAIAGLDDPRVAPLASRCLRIEMKKPCATPSASRTSSATRPLPSATICGTTWRPGRRTRPRRSGTVAPLESVCETVSKKAYGSSSRLRKLQVIRGPNAADWPCSRLPVNDVRGHYRTTPAAR